MNRALSKTREEARRLFLTGEMATNAEIAAHLKVKPHTVGRWRKDEDWDGLRMKIDRKASEMFVEKIATDKVTLNVKHYKYWDLILAKMIEGVQNRTNIDTSEIHRLAAILDRAQKGQRLAKGLSLSGETEETMRAKHQAEIQKLIDVFISVVKENVEDEKAKDAIRKSLLDAIPEEEGEGAGDSGNQIVY